MSAPILAAASHGMPALEAGSHGLDPAIVCRDTKGGRRLWYCLRVIQQPERARACGSGPKSSADRRPVDPPPVVELRIYEGQTWESAQDKDMTFVYNANFFLFATLEHARVIAHARNTPAPASAPPVLTGMPVSGMAYLDRPQEAGYFLFPDLSVRHEGRYRLTFNLYEETKEEKDKDRDHDSNSQPSVHGLNPATGGSFDFRMEVKSQEFVVYSAKKFPGLAESTSLSRVVAEQGCRVRIRRDVRMRRREGKGTADYDNAEDEYSRRRRTATPDTGRHDFARNRSVNGSTERKPYPVDPQRRPSIADYPPQYAAANPVPSTHLHFLGGSASSQYAAQPPPKFAQPPSVPASPVYPPTQGSSFPTAQSSYPPPPPPPQQAPSSYGGERPPSQSYPSMNPPPPPPRRESAQSEYRPASGSSQLSSLAPPRRPPTPQHVHLAPLKPHALPPLQIGNNMRSAGVSHAPPLPSPTMLTSGYLPAPSIMPGPSACRLPSPADLLAYRPPVPSASAAMPGRVPCAPSLPSPAVLGPINPLSRPPPAQYAGTKRARDVSFRQEVDLPRFQDGAREDARAEDVDAAAIDDLVFRRADGRVKAALPPLL